MPERECLTSGCMRQYVGVRDRVPDAHVPLTWGSERGCVNADVIALPGPRLLPGDLARRAIRSRGGSGDGVPQRGEPHV